MIGHIYDIYEPLRLALQAHNTIKADVTIIPIVISRSGTFNAKILAEVSQLEYPLNKNHQTNSYSSNYPPQLGKVQLYSMCMHMNGSAKY